MRVGPYRSLRAEEPYTFGLWCWRRLLGVPWTATRSNQSILKEINPEYSVKELMLKLQYLVDLMQRSDSLEKTLMLGKTEGGRREQQRMMWLDGITNSMDISHIWEVVKDREAWHVAVHEVTKNWTLIDQTSAFRMHLFSSLSVFGWGCFPTLLVDLWDCSPNEYSLGPLPPVSLPPRCLRHW